MPRTKQPRKKSLSDNNSLRERDFDKLLELQLQKLHNDFECQRRSYKLLVDRTYSLYPEEVLNMTLGDLLSYTIPQEEEQNEVTSTNQDMLEEPLTPPTVKPHKKARKRMKTTSDDGYATERRTPSQSSRSTLTTDSKVKAKGKRTRSVSRDRAGKGGSKHSDLLGNANGKENDDKNQTPQGQKRTNSQYGFITPKIKPNCALNILRRPKHGEVAVSMQGSPLLVSTEIQERTANLNLPLNNGNVVSLLPSGSLRMSLIPTLDAKTMEQLKVLKAHIEKVVNVNENRND